MAIAADMAVRIMAGAACEGNGFWFGAVALLPGVLQWTEAGPWVGQLPIGGPWGLGRPHGLRLLANPVTLTYKYPVHWQVLTHMSYRW